MPNNELFIVRPKSADKKEDKSITMTIRLERELQEEYDKPELFTEQYLNG